MMNDNIKTWQGFLASGSFTGVGQWLQSINADVWLPRVSYFIAIVVGILSIINFFQKQAHRRQRNFEEQAVKARHLKKLSKLEKEETSTI